MKYIRSLCFVGMKVTMGIGFLLLLLLFSYTPRDPSMNSETYHYKRGANQQFSQVCHVFDPSQYPEESLLYSFDREVIPIVIYCLAEEGEGIVKISNNILRKVYSYCLFFFFLA